MYERQAGSISDETRAEALQSWSSGDAIDHQQAEALKAAQSTTKTNGAAHRGQSRAGGTAGGLRSRELALSSFDWTQRHTLARHQSSQM